ncbi:MAG: type II secretion system protein [Phycisphaerales bacterium]
MTSKRPNPCPRSDLIHAVAGFTLIESVMSMLIVGLMLVAALNTIGASHLAQRKGTEQHVGPLLAQELMAEILSQDYQEPEDTVVFGRETGENSGSRATWDDVDDYDGWSASPPEAKDGTVMTARAGWTRSVTVAWADTLNLNNTALLPSGIKRIKVTVKNNGQTICELTALRTSAWPDDATLSGVNGEESDAAANTVEAATNKVSNLVQSLLK